MSNSIKKTFRLFIVIAILICMIISLAACKTDEDATDPNDNNNNNNQENPNPDSSTFNPIEVTDNTDWSGKSDYTITPVTYSNATRLKLAELLNKDPAYDLFDYYDAGLSYSFNYDFTSEELDRYNSLFEPEDSKYSTFGDFHIYYDKDDPDMNVCIMEFDFYTVILEPYGECVTQEDITAAQNFYNSLTANPVTVQGVELPLTYRYENTVYAANERGFSVLNPDCLDTQKRLTDDEDFAEGVDGFMEIISKSGIGETRLNAVLDVMKSQSVRTYKSRETTFNANDDNYTAFKAILDSIIMNISTDQIGLFIYNYELKMFESDVERWNEKIEDLDEEDPDYEYDLARYQDYKQEAINTLTSLQNIPQTQFLVFARILVTGLKTSYKAMNANDTKAILGYFYESEVNFVNMAKALAKDIDAINVGPETMKLFIETLADIRIVDAFFTGSFDNIIINQTSEDEEKQERIDFMKAYDNGTHDALYAIKDDFSAMLSVFFKVLNALGNIDLTDYNQVYAETNYDEQEDIYYIDGEEVTQQEYVETINANGRYMLKHLVSILSILTDDDYEVLFSNFDAAFEAMDLAFVAAGFDAQDPEDYISSEVLVAELKAIGALTDEEIQEKTIEDAQAAFAVISSLRSYLNRIFH